jgi:hypothetical protein
MVSPLRLETDLADGVITSEGEIEPGVDTLRGLAYPLGPAPEPGRAVQAAPGVLWLRLPLPMALNHVNIYAIEDGEGWALVDTGLNTPDGRAGWEAALAEPLGGRPVTRVIGTHMHPDHIGLAGWLCERFQAPLLMTQLEYVTARMLLADAGPAPEDGARFWRGTRRASTAGAPATVCLPKGSRPCRQATGASRPGKPWFWAASLGAWWSAMATAPGMPVYGGGPTMSSSPATRSCRAFRRTYRSGPPSPRPIRSMTG